MRATWVAVVALGCGALLMMPLMAPDCSAAQRPARPRKARIDGVRALLDAPHTSISRAELLAVDRDIGALLRDVAIADPVARRRRRALGLLGLLPTQGAFVCSVARGKGRASERRVAVRACATALGAKALPTLLTTLIDHDIYIREATVYGLGGLCSEPARAAIRQRRPVEPQAAVRAAMTAALKQRCTPRAAARTRAGHR